MYYAAYDTVTYGRDTIPTKGALHGPYTVVIIMYPNVYVRVNDGKPSVALVVTLDMGMHMRNTGNRYHNIEKILCKNDVT